MWFIYAGNIFRWSIVPRKNALVHVVKSPNVHPWIKLPYTYIDYFEWS